MGPADKERIPPGQRLVTDFPVLHSGRVQHVDRSSWTLTVFGLVETQLVLDWEQCTRLPVTQQVSDIHCVTGWTKLDTTWKGIRAATLLAQAGILADARHTVIHAQGGWTTNLPLAELLRDDVLLAYEYDGLPLSPDHGGPVRLLVPQLYFWKSAKWLTGIELTTDERLGFWETRGYHALGDPWREQRYS
jgi:DMSO/TMAO reductase YedYZ molybdopterin-dependent catalytic subunit